MSFEIGAALFAEDLRWIPFSRSTAMRLKVKHTRFRSVLGSIVRALEWWKCGCSEHAGDVQDFTSRNLLFTEDPDLFRHGALSNT